MPKSYGYYFDDTANLGTGDQSKFNMAMETMRTIRSLMNDAHYARMAKDWRKLKELLDCVFIEIEPNLDEKEKKLLDEGYKNTVVFLMNYRNPRDQDFYLNLIKWERQIRDAMYKHNMHLPIKDKAPKIAAFS